MDDEKQVEPVVNATASGFDDDTHAYAGPTEIDDCPAIKDWVAAPAFSLLGAFCWLIFWNIFNMVGTMTTVYMFEPNGTPPAIGFGVPAIAQAILIIFYAAVFYTSYFKEKPVLRSSKAISFMNYFMGGVIFGWCWNRNLKRSHDSKRIEKGISHTVAITLFAFAIVVFAVEMAMTPQTLSGEANEREASSQSSSAHSDIMEKKLEAERKEMTKELVGTELAKRQFHDAGAGVSFALSSGWATEGFREEGNTRWEAHPGNGELVSIAYAAAASDLGSTDEITASDLEGSLSAILDDCTDEEVFRTEIGGNDYWAVTASGTYSCEEGSFSSYIVHLYHIQNGVCCVFQYLDFTGDQGQSKYKNRFFSFMEDVVYE